MIAKAAFLFLFGTTLTSGQFWPRMPPYGIALSPGSKSSGCPSGPDLAPLICKFMQQDIGMQFKPPLIAPSTYIAPLVVEKCDTPHLQMEVELPPPVEKVKPLVIPQPPELPPMTIPKFPVPIIFEEPPAPLQEPCESTVVPEMPVMNIPTAPELPPLEVFAQIAAQPEHSLHEEAIPEMDYNTIEHKTVSIPQPPELPAFVMPELPVQVVEQELLMPAVPCLEDEPKPAPIPAYVEQLAPLPAAPELPAFVMPELPVLVLEQESPLPATPYLQKEPIPAPIPAYVEPLAPLPAAPELPVFMPEFPIRVQEQPMPGAPCLDEPIPAPAPAHIEPLGPLPAAPELPVFVMPELPSQVAAQELPMPALIYNMVDYQPVSVLQAPELPAFVMPELPIQVIEQDSPKHPEPCLEDVPTPTYVEALAPIPAAPELSAAPLPEFPVRVEIPSMPVIVEQPIAIPQPPALPAFVMPELPVHVAEQALAMPVAPYLDDQPAPIVTVPEYIKPLPPMPAAPELPPANLPEFPVRVEIPSAPSLPVMNLPAPPAFIAQPEPCITEEKPAPERVIIPQPPKLLEIKMPELPVRIPIDEPAPCEPSYAMPHPFYQKLFPSHITIYNEKAKETQNIVLPAFDSAAYPTPCVYNLVMKHVLPNMASNNFRSMENIEIQPAAFLPCS